MSGSLQDLRRQVGLLARRVGLRVVDDAGALQLAQVDGLPDEVLDGLEVLGRYGFTSVTLDGAEGLFLALNGSQSDGMIIATEDRRYRLKVADGEVAMYDDLGQAVHLKRDGIRITSAQKVDVVAPEVTVQGNATVTGNALVQGNATVNGTTIAKGDVKLGGANPVKAVMLADGSPSTKVKAL